MRLKFLYFFFIFYFYQSQSVHSQTTPTEIILADKYFGQKDYANAKSIYYRLIRNKSKIEKNALLKLAFIHEREKNITKTLYFLNLYFETAPSEKVITKMNLIATENNLKGYELSDFYLILLLVKQYSFVINLLLTFLGLYVLVIFIVKKAKNQPILAKHKIVFLLYLAGMLLALNISKFYKQGIVHQENTSIRLDPSSASNVYEQLPAGQRIDIIGSEDIWLRTIIDNKIYYINKSNVWLVN